jgi:hypothetical protein
MIIVKVVHLEKQEKPFMDDFVLFVIKGLFHLNIVENFG